MARTKRSRRRYSAGEWGQNRARVLPDPKTRLYQMEWRETGRRLTRSLGHRDWTRAKKQADEFADPEIGGNAEAKAEPLTLGTPFDIYVKEVTPAEGEKSRRRDRAGTAIFLTFFGRDRRPETLSQRDWDRFIQARRAGGLASRASPWATGPSNGTWRS